MDVTPLIRRDSQVIQAYGADGLKISGQVYPHPVIVYPLQVVPWEIVDPAQVRLPDFEPLIENVAAIEVLLIGTGKTAAPLPPLLRAELKAAGLAPEVMDTGAACRTYNVLLAEGRRVAAALIPPG